MQAHLRKTDMINMGSYYTPDECVKIAYNILGKRINGATILDTSCGYGSFFNTIRILRNRKIGADVDEIALKRLGNDRIETIHHNSLMATSRKDYKIVENEKLIVVGNPPYNDVTSLIRDKIKEHKYEILPKYKTRDLGISFLRSYVDLNPDYICVLHPLSYLIKKANFALLGEFTKKYKIIDAMVLSSEWFAGTAPAKTFFPIVIALYEKNDKGMRYADIEQFIWQTYEGKEFSLQCFDWISNYITKYPNQNKMKSENAIAYFWTMRDINALKRSKTFVDRISYNTILVSKEKWKYYKYVDIFKQYIPNVPYYLGNCDVFIDINEFENLKLWNAEKSTLDAYFRKLLGEHYVEN